MEIGTGGVDGSGNFVVTVQALSKDQRIYPRDTCNPSLLPGPTVVVQGAGEVPDVNGWGAAVLACALLLVMVWKLRVDHLTLRERRTFR